jgi:hypothetical protein
MMVVLGVVSACGGSGSDAGGEESNATAAQGGSLTYRFKAGDASR